MADKGLLFVFAECGPDVQEDEFNDWYDNEHAPLRLTVPGISNAARYKATDDKTPSWVAIYDTLYPSIMDSDAYKSLASAASDRERALIPRLAMLNRRVYSRISVQVNFSFITDTSPAKYLGVVILSVPPYLCEEFDEWYEKEHVPALTTTPGWLRSRCYKFVSGVELANPQKESVSKHNYLILHDWARDDYLLMISLATSGGVDRTALRPSQEHRESPDHLVATCIS
ncbi:hypothetical protein NLJ89_g11311 [Agrocybe chaxingu]|uniref:EthD domain-containing protein n=1 Tax=Agrocybe chaxingu TaxID=84603 RepID=A0A9W8JPG3_9AGAR|nr:hypothetical protein NLJ89_g11311 [Agrocybe chaxingu]